jgi:hypothetical protein
MLPGPRSSSLDGKSSGFKLAAFEAFFEACLDAWLPNNLSCHEGLHKALGV